MSDDYDDETAADEYDTIVFPACHVTHAHAAPGEDHIPPTIVRIVWCDPHDENDVVGEVIIDPEFARKLAAELVRQADQAESCIETHPDLLEFRLP